jgi:hypothetical protein
LHNFDLFDLNIHRNGYTLLGWQQSSLRMIPTLQPVSPRIGTRLGTLAILTLTLQVDSNVPCLPFSHISLALMEAPPVTFLATPEFSIASGDVSSCHASLLPLVAARCVSAPSLLDSACLAGRKSTLLLACTAKPASGLRPSMSFTKGSRVAFLPVVKVQQVEISQLYQNVTTVQ